MPQYFERACAFRERAKKLRELAADLTDSEQRSLIEQAAMDYERMAEAEAAKSTIKPSAGIACL